MWREGPEGRSGNGPKRGARAALDAWKAGEQLEDYQKKVAPVVVGDPQWEKGMKLTSYTLESKESQIGFDVQFSVKLSLEDKSGKKSEYKTTYNASTAPVLVIKRGD